jgi:hypothetical protein
MIAAAFLAGAVAGSLILETNASHTNVLLGEAIRVDVTWRATADVTIVPGDPSASGSALTVTIDDGEARTQYIEAGSNLADITVAPVLLRGGDTIDMSFWFRRRLLDGGAQRDLFERAGVVTMRVTYDDPSRGVQAAAAPMAFSVSVPTGEDAELLSELRRGTWLASTPGELRATIARYPTSRYTPFLRLKMHADRDLLLLQRIDPDTLQSIQGLNRDGFEALARRVDAETAADLLEGPSWPVLEADRLAAAVRAAGRAGDADRATRARAALFNRFASSGPAREIERDDAREAARR